MKILTLKRLNDEYTTFLQNFKDKYSYSKKDLEICVYDEKNPETNVSLILFTGGPDINPETYGTNKGKYTTTDINRDKKEFEIINRYPFTPKLGICRGAQLLTVASGGRLIQHVNNHHTLHDIETNFGMGEGHFKSYKMTSDHHQMMYPQTSLTKVTKRKKTTVGGISITQIDNAGHPYSHNYEDVGDYELIAWSKYYISTTYLNGANREMRLPSNFLEPEIVYYNKINGLAIQGHPEYSNTPDNTVQLIYRLMNKYLKM